MTYQGPAVLILPDHREFYVSVSLSGWQIGDLHWWGGKIIASAEASRWDTFHSLGVDLRLRLPNGNEAPVMLTAVAADATSAEVSGIGIPPYLRDQ